MAYQQPLSPTPLDHLENTITEISQQNRFILGIVCIILVLVLAIVFTRWLSKARSLLFMRRNNPPTAALSNNPLVPPPNVKIPPQIPARPPSANTTVAVSQVPEGMGVHGNRNGEQSGISSIAGPGSGPVYRTEQPLQASEQRIPPITSFTDRDRVQGANLQSFQSGSIIGNIRHKGVGQENQATNATTATQPPQTNRQGSPDTIISPAPRLLAPAAFLIGLDDSDSQNGDSKCSSPQAKPRTYSDDFSATVAVLFKRDRQDSPSDEEETEVGSKICDCVAEQLGGEIGKEGSERVSTVICRCGKRSGEEKVTGGKGTDVETMNGGKKRKAKNMENDEHEHESGED